MFRDMLSGSRAIFIGLVFFVLVVGGSLLYSWHVHHTTDAELAETQRKVQPLKNDTAARTAQDTVDTSTVDFEHAGTDLEIDDAQAVSDDTSAAPNDDAAPIDLSEAFLPDDLVSEEEIAADVPVSPFGFGPYPEVPQDFDYIPSWHRQYNERTRNNPKIMKRLELLSRVQIKAWKEGVRGFDSASTAEGKVYLHFPNTVYVKYEKRSNPDGSVTQHITRLKSGDVDVSDGVIPAGVQTIDMDEAGYDPYTYLDLPNN